MKTFCAIDIQTLGVNEQTVVLTVRAVKFNPFSEEPMSDKMYLKLDPVQQKSLGRTVTASTLEFWSGHDPEIREAIFGPKDQLEVTHGLKELSKFLSGVDMVWSHGYGFDLNVLGSLFDRVDLPRPWKHYQIRDTRTLFGLFEENPSPKNPEPWNSLKEASVQAYGIRRAFKELYG